MAARAPIEAGRYPTPRAGFCFCTPFYTSRKKPLFCGDFWGGTRSPASRAVGADAPQKRPPVRGRGKGPALGLSHGRLAKLRLRTVHDLDRRTRSYRRAMAVVDELTALMGGPDAITLAQRHAIEHAGMLASIADDLTARAIAGMSVNLDEALRAGNAARRARRAVLESKPEPKPTERPGLAIARRRWAENAARAAAKKDD